MRANLQKRQGWQITLALAQFLLFILWLPAVRADEPVSTVKFEVVGGEKERPIENASVYVKFTEERTLARDKHVEWRAKTNREGLAEVRYVRRGKVLIQVVAEGWKTYGKYHDITEEEQTIKIKLARPRRWY